MENIFFDGKPHWYFHYHPSYWVWQIYVGRVKAISNKVVFNFRLGIIDFGYAY